MYTLIFVLWLTSTLLMLSFTANTDSILSLNIVKTATSKVVLYPEQAYILKLVLSILNKKGLQWNQFNLKVENKEWTVKVEDEGSKLNPNKLNPGDLSILLTNCGLLQGERKDIVVDSFLDWLDKDNFRRLNGAESEYYESLPQPYKPRNGPMLETEEILYIKGIDDKLYECLIKVLSVYGTGKIDINTASEESLKVLGLSEEETKKIVEARKENTIKDWKDLEVIIPGAKSRMWAKWISFKFSGIAKIILYFEGTRASFIVNIKNKKVLRYY